MIEQAQKVLDALRMQNGLYRASPSHDYHFIWIRDNCYAALTTLFDLDDRYEQTYYAMFDIFRRYGWKLDYHARHRPKEAYEYIHPRYTVDGYEVPEPWGNAQNDAVGAFLFGVGEGLRRNKRMFRDEEDRRITALLVDYLGNLEYWHDEDNGMWEENREVHVSSIGACVAGLLAISPYIAVPWEWIVHGLKEVFSFYPRESASKRCDLAELSLIYPYRLLPFDLASHLITEIEQNLLRDKGTIRYKGDVYYAENDLEAQWSMGLPWLGLAYLSTGYHDKAVYYLERTEKVMTEPGVLPELFFGQSMRPNGNTPLAWSVAMYLVLAKQVDHIKR